MKIAHISDIHFRGSQRHFEYAQVCEKLFESLAETKPDFVVCTGDIFHTKTSGISPEIIELLCWFFRSIADKIRLVMILGNHDGNLTNLSRQDAISPIIYALKHPNIFLLKNSKPLMFEKEKIIFFPFSCFDKEHWSDLIDKRQSLEETIHEFTSIALFHGSVAGCKMDNGMVMIDGEVNLEFFKDYDIALLGDIHSRQGFRPNNKGFATIAYPGSMIQQNFGEELNKGYLLWELDHKTVTNVTFHVLQNSFPFISAEWKGSIEELCKSAKEIGKVTNLKGTRVRVLYKLGTLNPNEKRAITHELCDVLGVEGPITFKQIKTKTSEQTNQTITNEVKQNTTPNIETLSSLNLRDPEVIFDLYTKTIGNKPKTIDAVLAKKFINHCMEEAEIEQNSNKTGGSVWQLKEMHFDNLFRYGENNKINFTKLHGITGLFGDNRIGKSSIIGIIMFGLFNATDRGPAKISHIINHGASKGSCTLVISVDGVDYYIERTATKLKGKGGLIDDEKAVTNLNIFKVNVEGKDKKLESIVSQTEDSKPDSDKFLRNLIGTADDFLLTALSSQGNMNMFIEKGSTERKGILNRMLGFDLFEKMAKPANDQKNILAAKLEKRSSELLKNELINCKVNLEINEAKLETLQKELEILNKQHNELLSIDQQNNESLIKTQMFSNKFKELEVLKTKLLLAEKTIQTLKIEKDCLSEELETLKKETDSLPTFVELNLELEKLAKIEKEITKIQTTQKITETTKTNQLKNIKKLTLVPCGDMFKECHFIKDAHEDQTNLEATKETLAQLSAELDKLYSLRSTLLYAGHKSLLDKRTANEKKINELKTKENILEIKLINILQNSEINKQIIEKLTEELKNFSQKHLEENYALLLSNKKNIETKVIEIKEKNNTLQKILVEIGSLRHQRINLEESLQDVLNLEKQYNVAETISQAFSKTGIPALILKEQLPKINSELEKISSEVSDFKLSLSPDAKSNALNVLIEDNTGQRLVDLGSGAEKMIASLALRIALYNLSILSKPDFFIIDESFNVLDEKNRPKLVGLLQTFKTIFKNVLIISHFQDVKEAADNLLEIDVNETTSSICAV